jgi:multiple sugar transport system substrate-binding protein
MTKRSLIMLTVLLLVCGMMAACGDGSDNAGGNSSGKEQAAPAAPGADNSGKTAAPQVSKDPVEILVYSNFPETADDFDDVFVKPVKAKYPNITLKLTTKVSGHPTITEQVAAGQVPDIMIGTVLNLFEFQQLGLFSDMTPEIKKFNFDMNRIDPAIIQETKTYSDKGELYGIPYEANFTALYYNKDLFDKFAVAYPKDGMMWDDVVELTKKVTRNADGVQYRGLEPENVTRMASPLGFGFIDPKTNKPLIQSWKPAYDLLQRIITIPGNAPPKVIQFDKDSFFKDKIVSMIATTNVFNRFADANMNWDVVTYPQYPDHKGTFGVAGGRPLMISSKSKHRDQAFQVIETVMSDEIQIMRNKTGKVTTLASENVLKTFAADLPYAKGKNIKAVYALKPGWRVLSEYDDLANPIVFKHSVDMYSGKDINTVIRETEEDITKAIQTEGKR